MKKGFFHTSGKGRVGVVKENISKLQPEKGEEKGESFLRFFFPVLILMVFLTGNGLAAESKLIPSAAFKQEYNDNVFFDSEGEQRDFITTVSPGLEWIASHERGSFRIFGRLDWLTYWENRELNATDYLYQGDLQYRLSPWLAFSGSAGGSRDSQADRDLKTTGLILGTTPRNRWFYNLSGSYSASEKNAFMAAFSQNRDDFEDPILSDSEGYDGSIQFTRAMTETLQGKASLSYGHYSFETSKTTVYGLSLGADWAITEKWSAVFDLGLRYTVSEFLTGTLEFVPPFFVVQVSKEESRNRYGGVGLAGLTYKGESCGLLLTFKQDIAPASGVGATRSSSLLFQVTKQFTYELSGSFSASYVFTKADAGEFSSGATDVQAGNLDTRLRYAITNDMAIEGSYQYARSMDRTADTVANRNLFLVRFYIQHDLLER